MIILAMGYYSNESTTTMNTFWGRLSDGRRKPLASGFSQIQKEFLNLLAAVQGVNSLLASPVRNVTAVLLLNLLYSIIICYCTTAQHWYG